MILTGQNFTAESKVVFTEKTPGMPLFASFLLILLGGEEVPSCRNESY